ncbi:hypothetical protein NE237_024517 [Protea cynaroides]|uniref:Rhomboid-like protein 19 n=1 Tax=Protea cynaroides TaxID=273540 RepID=A0A9Q0JZ98_9MAGN|nr:hypothetical protein NE237_024517 [Protea cynaroides]
MTKLDIAELRLSPSRGLSTENSKHRNSDWKLPTMSSQGLAGGSSFFSGFTRLCKGLVVVLVGGYAIAQILPPAVTYLALIPARTIPFGWNLITAGYIEQSVFGVVVSAVGLLFLGKVLEPIWGSREFLKFIFVVNLLTYVSVFVTAIALYYITRQELYLYTPLSGFHGVLSGFLVGIKQIVPDQELSAFSVLKIKAKWVPSLVLLMSIAISFFTEESTSYLPTLVFGTYTSWIYLRYLQRKPETNLLGDPSEEFAFSTFFPEFLRPLIDPIASVLDWMFCGRSRSSDEAKGYNVGDTPLPGSDSIEATRRRERGARALEERLAAERLAAGGSVDNLPSKDAAENSELALNFRSRLAFLILGVFSETQTFRFRVRFCEFCFSFKHWYGVAIAAAVVSSLILTGDGN